MYRHVERSTLATHFLTPSCLKVERLGGRLEMDEKWITGVVRLKNANVAVPKRTHAHTGIKNAIATTEITHALKIAGFLPKRHSFPFLS